MGSFVKLARELDVNPDTKNRLWLTAFYMVACHFIHVQSTNVYNSKSLHYSLKLRVGGIIVLLKYKVTRFTLSQ